MKYWVERWSELRMKEMIHYGGNCREIEFG